jgi:hypothetical protein
LPFSTALSEAIIKPGGLPSDLGLSPTATVVEHEKIKRGTKNKSNLKIALFDTISHLLGCKNYTEKLKSFRRRCRCFTKNLTNL